MASFPDGRRHPDGSIDYVYYRRRAARWRRRVQRVAIRRGLFAIGAAVRAVIECVSPRVVRPRPEP